MTAQTFGVKRATSLKCDCITCKALSLCHFSELRHLPIGCRPLISQTNGTSVPLKPGEAKCSIASGPTRSPGCKPRHALRHFCYFHSMKLVTFSAKYGINKIKLIKLQIYNFETKTQRCLKLSLRSAG